MLRHLLLALLLFASLNLSAQDATHPIDAALDSCLNITANQTTYGMIQCTMQAYDAWDAALNDVYKKLMPALEEDEKQALRTAQRQWIAYRDMELEFSGLLHTNMQGTMYRVIHASRVVELTKQRVMDLQDYLDTTGMR